MTYAECQAFNSILWELWAENKSFVSRTGTTIQSNDIWKLYYKNSKRRNKLDKKWMNSFSS
jgi:hypothetical protein